MTHEEMKAESIERLKLFTRQGLDPKVVNMFNRNELYYSQKRKLGNEYVAEIYPIKHLGIYYDIWIKAIKDFEKFFGTLVYHVAHGHLDGHEVLILFYVCWQKEEWKYDKLDIEDNYPFVFVADLTDENCSEFMNVSVIPKGGLVVT